MTKTKASAKGSSKKQSPTVPLRCSKCGGTRLKVVRSSQMLQRTFRRDRGTPSKHLHARVACLNPQCHHQWWSAHETALATFRAMEARYDKVPKPRHGVERSNWEATRAQNIAEQGVDFELVGGSQAGSHAD